MQIIPEFKQNLAEYTAWRHALHQNAQTGFEETFASDFVAEKLASWGVTVRRGLGKTGVVGVLKGAKGEGPMIGLRADMDALDLDEQTNLPYASKNPGKMHACGHDGHVAMLLAAAHYLSKTRNFSGSVCFIFQPAEEGVGGAKAMMADGLFEKFPCQNVYGMHNWPNIPFGKAGLRSGPVMASSDHFSLRLAGKGGHAAFPHYFTDSVLCAAHVITALQSLVARNVNPLDSAVVSVAHVEGGKTFNVMPESVVLRGTARSFKSEVRELLKEGIIRIAGNVCRAFGAEAVDYDYHYGIDATVNNPVETVFCAGVLGDLLGKENIDTGMEPVMGAEDFGSMLEQVPGCFVSVGGRDENHQANIHSPYYDFNDALIPIGATYWVKLVEAALGD
ncbi:MAG: M20 family metallopeptidase [Alphaproteobacteria bacterium]|nr:M20 family metallopeptidase [Alphaproteobacteria bacterium]